MKMTIALTAVLLSAGTVMAQKPDSIPQASPKQWNADSAGKPAIDSNMANWKQDTLPQQKPVDTASQRKPMQTDKVDKADKVSDRVVMKDGELLVIKNGESAKMEKEIVLPSGTVIKTDGTLKKKDGSEIKLKDGQYIELPTAKKKKDDKESR